MNEQELIAAVEDASRGLADAMKNAETGGVSPALLFPALISVFKDAGMLPDWLDMDSLIGMVGG